MKDFYLEIGVEDIPPLFFNSLEAQLNSRTKEIFTFFRIRYHQIYVFTTGRRLIVYVEKVAENQDDFEDIIIGPPQQNAFDENRRPTPVAFGFAKKYGVNVDDLEIKDNRIIIRKKYKGAAAEKILSEIILKLISELQFPKTMLCPQTYIYFARPIRWITAFYGKKKINVSLGELKSIDFTYISSLFMKGKLKIKPAGITQLKDDFKKNFVIIDAKERQQIISKSINNALRPVKLNILEDEQLLMEVNNMVEYPTAILGKFEDEYLNLPQIVLITVLKHHLKCFAVVKDDKLMPYFIGVRDGTSEYLDIVREGYKKVVKARLEDAQFFFQQDRQTSLEEKVEKLKKIVFHQQLGSLYDKTQRVIKISDYLACSLNLSLSQRKDIERIAFLSKADLVCEMVREFPELEGKIGKEYALLDQEKEIVAKGIEEHYFPLSMEGELPSTVEAAVVSLADKLDTLFGDFAIGLIPTGSQDPYGLRRCANGAIRIILQLKLDKNLEEILDFVKSSGYNSLSVEEKLKDELKYFLISRLENILQFQNFKYDEIEAVKATKIDNIFDFEQRVKGIHKLREKDDFKAITVAFKRASNILKQAREKKIDFSLQEIDKNFLSEEAEIALHNKYLEINSRVNEEIEKKNYLQGLKELIKLRKPIDKFFDDVLVFTENINQRNNRLQLLEKIVKLFLRIADFSKIVEGGD